MGADLTTIADRLIAAHDTATTLPPITTDAPDFSVADGYTVLHDIETRRRAQGWQPAGRKIGFTNRTIWPRYGVYQPMWAHVWTHTVHFASGGTCAASAGCTARAAARPAGTATTSSSTCRWARRSTTRAARCRSPISRMRGHES